MKVLFIPSASVGNGIGHLMRSISLLGSYPEGALLVESTRGPIVDRIRAVAHAAGLPEDNLRLLDAPPNGERWQCVVVDRRETSAAELERFAAYGPVVALDEGGEARRNAPYLIDTLPQPGKAGRANIFSTAFLPRPAHRRSPEEPPTGRALITFGGEDLRGLTSTLATLLVERGYYRAERLTIVRGPLFRPQNLPAGVEFLESPPDLRDRLRDYDTVFTSFGLTAYEAAHAGAAVILFNPTPYHRTLSRIAGFPEIGVRRVRQSALRSLLADPKGLLEASSRLASGEPRSIDGHLAGMDLSRAGGCPVCGGSRRSSIGRFPDRTFFRCDDCSMVYEIDFSLERRRYDKAYFFEDYQRQYGRTYLDDFDTIRTYGAARLDRMARLGFELRGKRLLDVGCAYGAFLAEARLRGAEVLGIDVAESAVEYVTGTLSFPCACTSIEELDIERSFATRSVDAVTMWYVIEHLPRLGFVLDKINRLLPMGGAFAFSTPNLSGISGRSDLERFLQNSPHDHVTLWDPRSARRVLSRHGFRVREIHVTGHHPERFRVGGSNSGWKYDILRRLSELRRLGDTFECYAEKVSEQEQ